MNKKLLKNAIIMATMVLFVPLMATAQVTIGSTQVPRATLDVRAAAAPTSPQGIIPPQFSVAQVVANRGFYITVADFLDANGVVIPQSGHGSRLNGAIIFVNHIPNNWDNDATGHSITRYVTATGHYFFDYGDGTDAGDYARAWRPLGAGAGAGDVVVRVLTQNSPHIYTIAPAANTVIYVANNNTRVELPTALNGAINGSRVTIITREVNGSVTFSFAGANATVATSDNFVYEGQHPITGENVSSFHSGQRFDFVFVAPVTGVPTLGNNGKWIAINGI